MLSLAAVGVLSACAVPAANGAMRFEAAAGPLASLVGTPSSTDDGVPMLQVTSDETTMTVDARDGAQVASAVHTLIGSRVAGVSVDRAGGVTRLMLDGTAADQQGARALFVVDGVPMSEDFRVTILVSKIAALDVLTDAQETRSYGPRGQAGVVSVTLRQR